MRKNTSLSRGRLGTRLNIHIPAYERERKRKKLIAILASVAIWLLLCPFPSHAQRVYRVSVILPNDLFLPAFEGLKTKMEELGYRAGKNVVYHTYNGKDDRDILAVLTEKLLQEKPDLIVAISDAAATIVAGATKNVDTPIVFLSVANPLRFIKSYASSGNNFTGIPASTIDLTEKRLELLTELIPGVKRAISLHHSKGSNYESNLHATREAAKKFRINLVEATVASAEDLIQRAPVLLTRKAGEAVIYPPERIVSLTQKTISPLLIKERLPSIAASIVSVQGGALATYGADYFALGQQGAVLVIKILKGAMPADLPIEQPFKLKLVINLKTAKAIGLKIPRDILIRADEIVE